MTVEQRANVGEAEGLNPQLQTYPRRAGFDESMAGKHAECDGGTPMPSGGGTHEEFIGVLTGEYVDHGENPPWRWYRMTELSRKPDGYDFDEVWCEKDSVYVMENTQ
jgi:hypothetical protein